MAKSPHDRQQRRREVWSKRGGENQPVPSPSSICPRDGGRFQWDYTSHSMRHGLAGVARNGDGSSRGGNGDSASLATRQFLGMAAEHVSTLIRIAEARASVAEIRASLMNCDFDSVASVAVCEDDMHVGVIRIEALLSALPETNAADLMDRDPPVVAPRHRPVDSRLDCRSPRREHACGCGRARSFSWG